MPPCEYNFWIYIMSSRSLQLYIGITNDLRIRVSQHKELRPGTYTAKYNITRLVYFEHFAYVLNAIAREKELKKWSRERKLQLIQSTNRTMQDLSMSLWPTQFAPELP